MGGNDGKVNGPMGGKEGKVKSGIDGMKAASAEAVAVVGVSVEASLFG